jgi:hypothetical protein
MGLSFANSGKILCFKKTINESVPDLIGSRVDPECFHDAGAQVLHVLKRGDRQVRSGRQKSVDLGLESIL